MPNPYDDIFGASPNKEPIKPSEQQSEMPEDSYDSNSLEPLDEILASIEEFNIEAAAFSKLLTHTRAVDHKVSSTLLKLFVLQEDKHDQGSLAGERSYHALLTNKFENIIGPMKALARRHLDTVKQFNRDIDKGYYSIDKTDVKVELDKSNAIDGINLQRKILADAAGSLGILEHALEVTEKRIKQYVNKGGENNISNAEFELIAQKRSALTRGLNYQFNYSFFDVNLLDKTAISLGIYLQETTAQYLSKLSTAFLNQ